MSNTTIGSPEWQMDTELLVAQKERETGVGFCEHEMRPITGTGGFDDQATYALGFSEEHFGLRDIQAVSCNFCGGVFVYLISVMRRHRLRCGWTT